MKLLSGDPSARAVSERIAAPVATLAVLKSTPADKRVDGQAVHVIADNTFWIWNSNATASGDDILAVTPTDAPSTGKWMRMPGAAQLALPLLATSPTGTNLLVVPSGSVLRLKDFAVKVTRVFTGASTAAIAVSSTNHPGHTGVGGFMGSCVATQLNNMFSATAMATGMDFLMGPIASGTFDTYANQRTYLKGGDTIRQDVIGTTFGTGVGAVLVACDILSNPGV